MIDYEKLNKTYGQQGFYSLQLEVGDLCYQGCIYCYMNALDTPVNTLTDDQIENIIKDAKKLDITAIEWLGGEPLLRKSVFDHIKLSSDLGLRNNIWTGGLPLKDDHILKNTAKHAMKGLIAVHVSTVNPKLYKELHPNNDSEELDIILNAIRKLLEIGYPPSQMLNSVTFTGLQSPEDMIETIDYFKNKFDIKTSLNVYHTYLRPDTPEKQLRQFIPSQDDVEKIYERYSRQWNVKTFPMNCVNKQYCSATLAVLCDGSVTPCATIREKNAPNIHSNGSLYNIAKKNNKHLTFAKFRNRKYLPRSCQTCELSDVCFGCRSRAYAAGNGIYGKDPRCFRS